MHQNEAYWIRNSFLNAQNLCFENNFRAILQYTTHSRNVNYCFYPSIHINWVWENVFLMQIFIQYITETIWIMPWFYPDLFLLSFHMQTHNGFFFILGITAFVLAFENQQNHPTKRKKVWKEAKHVCRRNVPIFWYIAFFPFMQLKHAKYDLRW